MNWEWKEEKKEIYKRSQTNMEDVCSVCDPFAHAPLKELGGGNVWMPQKYTSSQQFPLIFKFSISLILQNSNFVFT